MRDARRTTTILAATALLIGGGAGLGAIASSLTSASIKAQPVPRAEPAQTAIVSDVDQESAGKSWARTAFDGGLRQCPAMNAEFLTACQAEMKALAARPGFVPGSYRGRLLVTKVVQPEPEPDTTEYREASYVPDIGDEPVESDEAAEPQPY
ncbi:MAG: hypothetical protein JSS55_03805 [Proteobacteria bacterium]|nr:hypothetical protein [Pseudomonadota bacterium]